MDYEIFEWVTRIGWLLRILLGLVVGIVAVVVAAKLTRKRVCREAAWLLALGWLASWSISVVQGVVNWFLMPWFGWGVARWIVWGLDLLDLGCALIIIAGLFMFRAARGASHG